MEAAPAGPDSSGGSGDNTVLPHSTEGLCAPNRLDRLPQDLLGTIWCLLPIREAVATHHRICKPLLVAVTESSAFWHRFYRYLCAVGEFAGASLSRTSIAYLPPELLLQVRPTALCSPRVQPLLHRPPWLDACLLPCSRRIRRATATAAGRSRKPTA